VIGVYLAGFKGPPASTPARTLACTIALCTEHDMEPLTAQRTDLDRDADAGRDAAALRYHRSAPRACIRLVGPGRLTGDGRGDCSQRGLSVAGDRGLLALPGGFSSWNNNWLSDLGNWDLIRWVRFSIGSAVPSPGR
jgi:hypothetical protein